MLVLFHGHAHLDRILANCRNIYRTHPGLEGASYRQHLDRLPPAVGLSLAVADGLRGLARMASGLIALDRVRALIREEAANPHHKTRYLDIMTVPLDEVARYPGHVMEDFLDFAFGAHLSSRARRRAATEYERRRRRTTTGEEDRRSVADDDAETEKWIGLLRGEPIFGGPLRGVESLVESGLSREETGEAGGR